jgi:singapore isolate B (sub-type 7) whole genome shotgun sequence assembly, scaffold_3
VEKLVGSLQFMDNEEQNHHTIFVDNEDDFKTWKPEEYFDTIPELVNRKYNRLSKQQLEDEEFVTSLEDEKQLSNMKKRREQRYKDLGEALDDQETIDRVLSHVQLRKNMNGKGKRFKVADGENGHAAVYRWQFERKK